MAKKKKTLRGWVRKDWRRYFYISAYDNQLYLPIYSRRNPDKPDGDVRVKITIEEV